jgi:UDP-galactose transporter B1
MSKGRQAVSLVLSVLGLYASYIAFGVVQERIHATTYGGGARFRSPAFLILFQVAVNTCVGLLSAVARGDSLVRGVPVLGFAGMSLSYVLAMYSSNKALDFIDYPTQVVAKSVKMIPVMVGGVLFLGKRHPVSEYVEVGVITLGITMFFLKPAAAAATTAAGAAADAAGDWRYTQGLLLSTFSLFCDGLTSTLQDGVRASHSPSGPQFMLYMNLWSTLFFAVPLTLSGEAASAVAFLAEHHDALFDVVLFGLTSAMGQLFIFAVLSGFGPLVLTMSTTTRKFFSILLSVIWFSHPLSMRQWTGAALVFGGLIAHTLSKWNRAGKGSVKKDTGKKAA